MLFNEIENFKKYILLNKLQKLSTLPNIRIILVKIHCKEIRVICESLLHKQYPNKVTDDNQKGQHI